MDPGKSSPPRSGTQRYSQPAPEPGVSWLQVQATPVEASGNSDSCVHQGNAYLEKPPLCFTCDAHRPLLGFVYNCNRPITRTVPSATTTREDRNPRSCWTATQDTSSERHGKPFVGLHGQRNRNLSGNTHRNEDKTTERNRTSPAVSSPQAPYTHHQVSCDSRRDLS